MKFIIKECKDKNKRTGEKCADDKEIKKFVNELMLTVFIKEMRIDWTKRNELPLQQ